MKKLIYLIISLINSGIMAVYLAFNTNNKIPLHFGIDGTADRYGSKWELLAISFIPFVMALIYIIVTAVAKRFANENKNAKYSGRIFTAIFIFMIVFVWLAAGMCLNPALQSQNIFISLIIILVGFVFTFVSNLMPKLKQNKTMGLKIKATLSSEYVWNKTHRLEGLLGVTAGIIMMILGLISFLSGLNGFVMLAISLGIIIIATVIIPWIYADILYKKEKLNK